MKKIISILISMMIIFPYFNVSAETSALDKEEKYNNIIENTENLGVDNLNNSSNRVLNNSPVNSESELTGESDNAIKNLVILIRFKGEEEFMTEENSKALDEAYNSFVDLNNDKVADLGSVSLNSYINDLTYGNLKVKSYFYPKKDNSYYSVEAPETRSYYENYAAGSNKEKELIDYVINEVKGSIDLTDKELDRDNDGIIDMVTFLVSGGTIKNNMLWPHETVYLGNETINGMKIYNYNLINEGNYDNNIFNKKSLKIVIHEFLHSLGYPDLYRYYSNGIPVGEWDIMASSSGNGQLPLVYTRNTYGNLNINIGEITEDGVYTLKNTQSSNKDDVLAFKIKSPLSEHEYFMVEYRKNQGNWDSGLSGSGLIVYRINESVNYIDGNRNGSPDHIYVFRPNESDNIHSFGTMEESFLSKESGRTSFGSSLLTTDFIPNSLFFADGTNSRIVISEVGDTKSDSISFKVTFPKESNTINLNSIIGKTRYDTAALISKESFKDKSTVVLVNGSSMADGLSVTPIASYLNSPILLVDKNTIPEETQAEIIASKTKNVIIAGAEGVISKNVEKKLKELGVKNITRLGGSDRYKTSFEILKYIDENLYDVSNIIVGNGLAEADIMSIAAIAGKEGMPIVLSKKDSIEGEIYTYLKKEDIMNAYIVGGEGVTSNTLLNSINSITSYNIINNRLGGINRYETNAIILDKFYKNKTNSIYVTKGLTLVDALSIGPVSSNNNYGIVLADSSLNSKQSDILSKMNISNITQIGGGVSTKFLEEMRLAISN